MSLERGNHYSLPPRASARPRTNARMSPETRVSSISSVSTMSESPFQMMDIVVSVDIMEGLVMECKDKQGSHETSTSNATTSQIMGSLPVTTFLSCKKNVSSTRTISTHVPSLPLSKPSSSHGGKHHHFLVRWPADFDPHGDALSTFKLTRLMKKESGGSSHNNSQLNFGYVPEEVELTVGLMRGSEMITLGLANLVITGEETEEMIIDLPINITKEAVKDSKNRRRSASPLRKLRSPSKSSLKVLKPAAFPSDPRRKYRLSDQSMIRLQVKITPKCKSSYPYEDSEGVAQFNENLHFDSTDDYRYRMDYDSNYDGSSNRAAPMDELQDDFNFQLRLNEEEMYERRAFGKEIPRLTQDYFEYGRSVDNTYELEKTKSYDLRRGAEIRSRDREYSHDDITPSLLHQSGLVYSNTKQLEPRQAEPQYHKNVHRSSSRHRSGSRQRASSRQRSVAHDHDHHHHRHHHRADPRLYDRSGSTRHKYDLKTRTSEQHFVQMKPTVRDENRQNPAGVANWFLENVVGSVQGSSNPTQIATPKNSSKIPREKMIHHPKVRQQMPPMSRHFEDGNHHGVIDGFNAPPSHTFEDTEYYHNNEEYYDENENYNERAMTRRISSMR